MRDTLFHLLQEHFRALPLASFMFSSSVAGGSICLGCQLRAATRRVAAPIGSTAAQTRIRNRKRSYFASSAARLQKDDVFSVLETNKGSEPKTSRQRVPSEDWDSKECRAQDAGAGSGRADLESGTGSHESQHTAQQERESTRPEDFIQQAISGSGQVELKDRIESQEPTTAAPEQAEPTRSENLTRQVIDGSGSQVYFNEASEPVQGHANPTQQQNVSEAQLVRWVRAPSRGPHIQEPPKPESPKPEPPKSYRKRGFKLVEDFRKLTVDTLGKKADIIVLKDGGKWKRVPLAKDEKAPVEAHEDYADQESSLSMETVMENIEEFRPKHHILPAREFKVLFDTLMRSFTAPQISEYVVRYHERVAKGEEPPSSATSTDLGPLRPWIVSDMRWIPQVRGALPNAGPNLQGYILKSMPAKQRRVMQLMRECWAMSVQELTSGLGVLEVKVRDLEFKLLTLGQQRFLTDVTRLYLGKGKGTSISAVKSQRLIRIEAPKAVAESALAALDERAVQKIKSKTFSMDKATFANLDVGVVEELGQLTNSVVSLDSERNEIEVTWIDYKDRSASKLEDLGDTVFRLLLTGNPPSNVEHSLATYPHITDQSRLVEDLNCKDKLPWMHRRMKWARVCLPALTSNTLLEEAWSYNDGVLKYGVVPIPQDFENTEPKNPSQKMTRPPRFEEVGKLVEERIGTVAGPLAIPTGVAHRPILKDEPPKSEEPSSLEDLLELDAKVKAQPGPGLQQAKESQTMEEPQLPPEQEAAGAEHAELEESQATNVSEEVPTPSIEEERPSTTGDRSNQALMEQEILSGVCPPLSPRWSPFQVRTNAVFGHILHHFQSNSAHSADTAVTTTKALENSPRAFSPLIPPVSKMDLPGWVPYNKPINVTQVILMRFVPSNDKDSTTIQHDQTNPAPLLELRIKAADEYIIEIDSLRAVARTHVSDVLFPGEAVDARMTQCLESILPGNLVESTEGMTALTTFLSDSVLELGQGKLLTPPRITDLGLPQWMFRDHHDEFLTHKKSLAASAPSASATKSNKKEGHGEEVYHSKEEEPVPLRRQSYVFAGLEVHRRMETVYDGWKLFYTSIEAGQGGGHRAELSLEARPAYDTKMTRAKEQINSKEFLQSVYTIVRGLPGKFVGVRPEDKTKMRTTIEWLGAGKRI